MTLKTPLYSTSIEERIGYFEITHRDYFLFSHMMLYMKSSAFFISPPHNILKYCLKENGIENGESLISVDFFFREE